VEFAHGYPQLHSGQVRTQATVRAATEGADFAAERYGLSENDLDHIEERGRLDIDAYGGARRAAKELPWLVVQISRLRFGGIGPSTHFLELQEVEEILDPAAAEELGIRTGQVTVQFHNGGGVLTGQLGELYARRKSASRMLRAEMAVQKPLTHLLTPRSGLLTVPPFCAPHHTSSMAAIVGGGSGGVVRPGAASLAHRGILFLDEAPEFNRDVLDALRQPLESGEVVIARAGTQAVFPARFTLVLAANPCPCAKSPGPGKTGCSCSPATRRRYLARISGPLLDRVDVKVRLQPVSRHDMLYDRKFAEPSAVVAERVAAARERCAARLAGTPWRVNAEVPGTALRRAFPPKHGALTSLDRAMELGQVSARGADKIVRVAWSLADLSGKDEPGPDQVNLAIGLWLGVAQ